MVRLLRMILLLYASVWLVFKITAELSWRIEVGSFALGIVAAAIVGFAEFQLNEWWAAITKPHKPQVVKITTKETPAQITGAASSARRGGSAFFAAIVGLSLYQFASFRDPIQIIVYSVVAGLGFYLVTLIVPALTVKPAGKTG